MNKVDQFFQNSHYNIARIVLSVIGLWPFQSTFRRYTIYFAMVLVIGSGFMFEMMGIIDVRQNVLVVLDNLPLLFLAILSICKTISMVYMLPKIKLLLIKIQEYYLSPKSDEEYKIHNSHALYGRNLSHVYTYIILSHSVLWNVAILLTRLIRTETTKNDTSSNEIINDQIGVPYRVNYMIDIDTYYAPIFIHTAACGTCYVFQAVTVDVLYITLIEHCRGLFETVRYCLENALSKNNDGSIKISTRDKSYLNVTYSVRRHAETIQFINIMNTVFSPTFFIHMGGMMLSLSILGYQILINIENPNGTVKYFCFLNGIIINIFFENWQGQRIIDSSEKIFESAYNAEWYNMPTSTRKLLLMIMMKSIKPMVATAGKIMILSYITFNTVIRTSMSYFMLLRSVT